MDEQGNEDAGSEHESNVSEEDDYIDDLPEDQLKEKQKGNRSSVSAEAFGLWNKKTDFRPPVHHKTPQVVDALKKRLE